MSDTMGPSKKVPITKIPKRKDDEFYLKWDPKKKIRVKVKRQTKVSTSGGHKMGYQSQTNM